VALALALALERLSGRRIPLLSICRAVLVDAGLNRRAARRKLDIPVPALGGSAFIGDRSESRGRLAHDVTGHVFDAGHDLAQDVPQEMAAAVLAFLAAHLRPAA
jgi:hypothetical protein